MARPAACVCGGRFSSGFYDHVSNALDGRVFILDEFHKAYHHYIKVARPPPRSRLFREPDT